MLFINAKLLPLNVSYHKTLSELMHASIASAPTYVIYLRKHPVSSLTTDAFLLPIIFT